MEHVQIKWFKFFGYAIIILTTYSSCVSAKKAMFFSDIQTANIKIDSVSREASKKIYSGDRVNIQILTGEEENELVFGTAKKNVTQQGEGFLVDSDGYIDLRILGKFYVVGKTPILIRNEIQNKVNSLYKDAVVYCSITGRVVVLNSTLGQSSIASGASVGVASVQMFDERLTIPEVLSGIKTTNLKLDKAWIIREENGFRKIVKLNLNSADIFKSEYYYLRNNDVIYIEPRRFNQFFEANMPTRNLFGILTGLSGLALAVILALN